MHIQGDRFYFVRHAETDWNQKKLCQGLRDIPLNASGIQQALELGKKSKTLKVEFICSSPLMRAFQTAKCLQEFHPNAPIETVDDLKERDWGPLEGISSEKMYEIENKEELILDFELPNGVESRVAFRERILNGINRSFCFHSSPFIVSHGRVFLSLCEILNIPLVRQIPNLAIVEFREIQSIWSSNILTL